MTINLSNYALRTLIQVAISLVLRKGLVLLSPLSFSGSQLFYMERALRCVQFQPSGVPLKCGTKSCPCFLCLPCQSGSGSQELDGRTLPGCGAPSPLRGPSLSFPRASQVPAPSVLHAPSPSPCLWRLGACALCLAATLPGESQEVFD